MTTLNQRANYVRQRLTPHERGGHATRVRFLLDALDDALKRSSEQLIADVEHAAEPFAHRIPDPLSIRVGPIQHELDARSDGTPRGYRRVIMRDLARYYRLLHWTAPILDDDTALDLWAIRTTIDDTGTLMEINGSTGELHYAERLAILDAMERASLLVDDGWALDTALRQVGLTT